jgi:hypothetical protein
MDIEEAVELLFKTEEDDGVEAMLNVDDPIERRLALKFKHIEPYHLRLALHDEDPEIRKAAAHHPALTPELIKEVIQGDDLWLAEEVLKRPDLRSDELELAMENPELRGACASHPSLNEDQRNRLLDNDAVPESQKEAAMQSLIKNIGFLTYPQLGEGTVHSMPKIIDHRDPSISAHPSALSTRTGAPRIANTTYNSKGRGETPPQNRNLSSYVSTGHPYSLHGLQGHEGQHVVFSRLKQRFGREASYRVVASTLAGLDPVHRDHIFKLYRATGHQYSDTHGPEEAITYLHSYLQDPEYRRRIHVNLGISRDINKMRESVLMARKAWNNLRDRGLQLRPEDVGVEYKKDEQVLAEWVTQLKKSRDPSEAYADHLGYSQDLDTYLSAAFFLMGKELDPAKFSAALWECDGDLKDTVMKAAELDTPEKQKAFEAVLKLSNMRKNEVEIPKSIEAALTQGDDVAKDLQWAFGHNEVEPVKLGGRHSSGTMMARDNDGNLMLIKPGSGKQSPAAGAAQETASQSRREACFYHVAREIGINAVPRAELILIDGKEVAVFHMLGLDWEGLHRTKTINPGLPQKALGAYLPDGTLFKWAVLDYICGNPDRHGQNIMVGPADQGNKIALIDHGSAFAGVEFDPGGDTKSFVPYYLRVWGPEKGFNALSASQKLATMPVLTEEADENLRKWIDGLDAKVLEGILHRYGIHPEATLKRLRALQNALAGSSSASRTLNRFWIS